MTNPLLPDDYFALIEPELGPPASSPARSCGSAGNHGDATTVVIKPDSASPPHKPGQYLRIGMEINGIRHWRAYSITSDPEHPDGLLSASPSSATARAKVSPIFNHRVRSGQRVFLGEIEGEFTAARPAAGEDAVRLGRQRHHARS